MNTLIQGADLTSERETPTDGFGAGFLEYSIRTSFRDLCRLIGFENARAKVAEIIVSERERKPNGKGR